MNVGLAVDLWKPACLTYRLNHPKTDVVQGDLRDPDVQAKVLHFARQLDRDRLVVLGGIPCGWLSTYRHLNKVKPAERQKERETLDAVLELVKKINPRWWCLEDVKALLRELPILTPYQEINARRYSGQRRKRVFVGDFPPPAHADCQDVLRDKIRPGPYRIGRRAFGRTPKTHRTFTPEAALGAWLHRKGPTVAGISSRRDAEWVVVDERVPGGIRQIEWQEAAVLQGFPPDYVFYGSPTDVAAQVAPAIQIDVGRAIVTSMVRAAGIPLYP